MHFIRFNFFADSFEMHPSRDDGNRSCLAVEIRMRFEASLTLCGWVKNQVGEDEIAYADNRSHQFAGKSPTLANCKKRNWLEGCFSILKP
jgi:hypothetical protein